MKEIKFETRLFNCDKGERDTAEFVADLDAIKRHFQKTSASSTKMKTLRKYVEMPTWVDSRNALSIVDAAFQRRLLELDNFEHVSHLPGDLVYVDDEELEARERAKQEQIEASKNLHQFFVDHLEGREGFETKRSHERHPEHCKSLTIKHAGVSATVGIWHNRSRFYCTIRTSRGEKLLAYETLSNLLDIFPLIEAAAEFDEKTKKILNIS